MKKRGGWGREKKNPESRRKVKTLPISRDDDLTDEDGKEAHHGLS